MLGTQCFVPEAFLGCWGILAIYAEDSPIGSSVHELYGWWTSLQWPGTSHFWGTLECKYGKALFSLLLGFPEWGRDREGACLTLPCLLFHLISLDSVLCLSLESGVLKPRTYLSHRLQTVNLVPFMRMRLRESPALWCLKGALVVLSLLSFSLVSFFSREGTWSFPQLWERNWQLLLSADRNFSTFLGQWPCVHFQRLFLSLVCCHVHYSSACPCGFIYGLELPCCFGAVERRYKHNLYP